MSDLTPEQIAQHRVMRHQVIQYNGHVGYQVFMNRELTHNIDIQGLSAPLEAHPTAVLFRNPDLMEEIPANDMDNPDGAKFPIPMPVFNHQPVPEKKKTKLRVIK
jgi:hypothetical protein